MDRLVFAGCIGWYRRARPLKIVRPETVIRGIVPAPSVLAQEITTARGRQRPRWKSVISFARDESRQPTMGRPRISWRAFKLGVQCRANHVQVYSDGKRRPRVEDVLHNHADGIASMDLFVVPKNLIRLLSVADTASRSPPNPVAGVTAPPRLNGFAPAHRGLWLEVPRNTSFVTATPFTVTSSSAPSGDEHSGSANRAAIAVAEGYCERAIGSIRRGCLTRCRVRRVASSPSAAILRDLLHEARTHLSVTETSRRRSSTCRWSHLGSPFLADFIICICEFDFRQAQNL